MSPNDLFSRYKTAPIAALGFAMILVAQRSVMGEEQPTFRLIIATAGLLFMVAAIALEMWSYLSGIKGAAVARRDLVRIARSAAKAEVVDLQQDVEDKIQSLSSPFTDQDLEALKKSVVENLSDNTIEKIEGYFSKVDEDRDAKERSSIMLRAKTTMRVRLKQEIEELGRRANLNLVIGSTISILGMFILAYFIYITNDDFKANMDPIYLSLKFGARLSLVIFMQVFAYFFLRLYRYSIFEIKYFQNEMTNIELWILALQVSSRSKDEKVGAQILAELIKVERNFRLKKGETTVALLREEIEARYESAVMGQAEKLVDRVASTFRAEPKK